MRIPMVIAGKKEVDVLDQSRTMLIAWRASELSTD